MAVVRYVGPDQDGVSVPFGDLDFLCLYGEWVEVPDELAFGTPHVFVEGYAPDDDGTIDSDFIVEYGRGGLVEQARNWEVQRAKRKRTDEQSEAAE